MKKLFFLFIILNNFFLFSQNYFDIILLKNGSTIKGLILEQIPGQKIKVKSSDGSIYTIKYTDVEKITKEFDAKEEAKNENEIIKDEKKQEKNNVNIDDSNNKKSRKEQKKEQIEENHKNMDILNENLSKSQQTTNTSKTESQKTDKNSDETFIVGIFPFKGNVTNYVKDLQSQTIQSFSQKSRFTVVDRTNFDVIKMEKERQKSEEFLNGFVVEQGKNIGAKYAVTGELYNIGVTSQQFKKTDYNTKTYYYETKYSANLSFSLTLLDIETGEVKATNNFNIKTSDVGWAGLFTASAGFYNTESEALSRAMNSANGYIKGWINSIFPVKMKIIKVEETDKKGNPQVILIKGGIDTDLRKGSDLNVVYPEILVVEGKEYTKPTIVGALKVLEVEGDFSTCKIKSGADKIQELLTNGKSLTLSIKSYK